MACIILETSSGSRRLIHSGEPYRLEKTERVVGVDHSCGGAIVSVHAGPTIQIHNNDQPPTLAQELQTEVGPGYGDWIRMLAKPIAEVAGKRNCTACEARRIVTNAYGKLKAQHGQLKALGMIKDLWALSMKASGDDVLIKLRELLRD